MSPTQPPTAQLHAVVHCSMIRAITSVHVDSAPEPRRAAAGALFTITNTTSKQLLIHGGRLAAGHILNDLWQAQLGAGNITYQQLWPPQQQALQKKKGKKGRKPFGPAARKGHAAVAVEDPDACLVSALSLSSCVGGCICCDGHVMHFTNPSTNLQSYSITCKPPPESTRTHSKHSAHQAF